MFISNIEESFHKASYVVVVSTIHSSSYYLTYFKLEDSSKYHFDSWIIIQLKDSINIVQSMVYVSPSIDTNGWKNPSMRLYYLDSTTHELIDYEQYYFDLEEANKNGMFCLI